MIDISSDRDPIEILCEEFLDLWRSGAQVTIEEFAAQHPRLRAEILTVFPALLALEGVKVARTSEPTARAIDLSVDRLSQLGDYRILREIGRGGMAIVFEAEQQSLQRRVAIKIFPEQTFSDRSQLTRFKRESRLIAALHHNNIVPVFGTGVQDGMHYFVMQFLDGLPLDQVISELAQYKTPSRSGDVIHQVVRQHTTPSNMPTEKIAIAPIRTDQAEYWRAIAELLRQVAEGLHYAHTRGVLHRDIKPSNLIVDAASRIWITDFGLATTANTEGVSRTGDLIGTLRYMAPERLSGQFDIRSEVYSLGLTAYELVALRPAHRAKSNAGLASAILNERPPSLRSIVPDIPKDLETIIAKAIAFDPVLRYQRLSDFATDLANFVENRPILARRARKIEVLAKWAKRNPMLASLGTALLACILISLTVVTWNWRVAASERARAEVESARAESNLSLALGSMNRFLDRFQSDWMSHPVVLQDENEEPTAHMRLVASDQSADILEEALQFYQQFAEQNAGNPKLILELANAFQRIGSIRERLGQYESAEKAYRSGVETLSEFQRPIQDPRLAAIIGKAHSQLAIVLHARYQHAQAQDELLLARRVLTETVAQDDSTACVYELALVNSNLGVVSWWNREYRGSTRYHRAAIMLLEELVDAEPVNASYRVSLARAYRNFHRSNVFGRNRRYANEIHRSAVSLLVELIEDYPDVPDYQCELSELLSSSASRGEHGETVPFEKRIRQIDRSIELAHGLTANYPSIPRYSAALADAYSNKAEILEEICVDEAIALHETAVQNYVQLSKLFPAVAHYLMLAARAFNDQAQCLVKANEPEAAREAYLMAISMQKAYIDKNPSTQFGAKWLADYQRRLRLLEAQTQDADKDEV